MSLSTLSVISVIHRSVSICIAWFLSSLWTILSYFFACLVIFKLDVRYCEFCTVGCRIFCILLNIFKFCSETQWSYLETYWKQCDSSEACSSDFVRQDQSSLPSGAHVDPFLRQRPSELGIQRPFCEQVSLLGCWKCELFPALCHLPPSFC